MAEMELNGEATGLTHHQTGTRDLKVNWLMNLEIMKMVSSGWIAMIL